MMLSEYRPEHPLPLMFPMEQAFAGRAVPLDYQLAIREALEPLQFRIRSGMRIGIAVGSRGISGLSIMVQAVVDHLLSLGTIPIILPAMGSHGGATAEGQSAVLASYGVDSKKLGVPVEASMATVQVGETDWGTPVYWSLPASKLDGVLLINRIKPHTDFKGNLGSGILKMLVVGLGKRDGASAFHRASIQYGYETVLRKYAAMLLKKMPVIGGVGIIENALHETNHIAFIPAELAVQKEESLFASALELMPRLPFDNLDLLIIDRIGKNISGSGMDPNIVGRGVHGYSTDFSLQTEFPRIKRIMVRTLTPESHGNAIGVGMADFTTSRLIRTMDPKTSFVNAVTAMTMNGAKMPIHFETDQEVIQWALSSLVVPDTRQARILRIKDTLNLDLMEASENLLEDAKSHSQVHLKGEPVPMEFDAEGNLKELAED
jgi:hypothetical protein